MINNTLNNDGIPPFPVVIISVAQGWYSYRYVSAIDCSYKSPFSIKTINYCLEIITMWKRYVVLHHFVTIAAQVSCTKMQTVDLVMPNK